MSTRVQSSWRQRQRWQYDRGWMPAVMLMMTLAVGCNNDEASPTSHGTTPASAVDDSNDTTSRPSPETLAAENAFRTMTTDGVTPAEWDIAHQRLQEIGAPALPVLAKALKSDEVIKRDMASTVLAWFGVEAEPVADDLLDALNDESQFVQANVATALLQMPDHVDRVVPVLSHFLQSDNKDLKRMAATNLAAIDADKARPLLRQLIASLDDDDRTVVYYVTQLLGRIGPDAAKALPKLKALDRSDDEKLDAAITTAILLIDPDSEVP